MITKRLGIVKGDNRNVKERIFDGIFDLLILVAIALLVFGFSALSMNKINLNGEVNWIEGVATKVDESEMYIVIDNVEYGYSCLDDIGRIDFKQYEGKLIKIATPKKMSDIDAKPWVLGLIVDGETVLDYEYAIEVLKSDDLGYILGFLIPGGVLTVAILLTIAIGIAKSKKKNNRVNDDKHSTQDIAMDTSVFDEIDNLQK